MLGEYLVPLPGLACLVLLRSLIVRMRSPFLGDRMIPARHALRAAWCAAGPRASGWTLWAARIRRSIQGRELFGMRQVFKIMAAVERCQ